LWVAATSLFSFLLTSTLLSLLLLELLLLDDEDEELLLRFELLLLLSDEEECFLFLMRALFLELLWETLVVDSVSEDFPAPTFFLSSLSTSESTVKEELMIGRLTLRAL
jgi:hypothetical protein